MRRKLNQILFLLFATGMQISGAMDLPGTAAFKSSAGTPSGTLPLPDDLIIAKGNKVTRDESGYCLTNPAYNVFFHGSGVNFYPLSEAPRFFWSIKNSTDVEPEYCENKIVYRRDDLIEEYLIKPNSIEQQFIIGRPLLKGVGSLKIEGTIYSDGALIKEQGRWVWKNKIGQVSLSDVYAYDACLRRIPAKMNVTATGTTIEVLAEHLNNAAFPVTIDPEIGTNDFRISSFGPDGDSGYKASQSAIAYSTTANRYLVVWQGVNAGESEIYGQLLNGTTLVPEGAIITISNMGPSGNTSYSASDPDVVSSGTEFLIVWRGDDNTPPLVDNEFEIFGQRVNASTGALVSGRIRVSDMGPDGNTSYGANLPSVVYNSTSSEYLVVWEGDDDTGALINDEFEIFAQRLSATGDESAFLNDVRISNMGPDGFSQLQAFSPDVAWNSTNNQYLVVWEGDDSTVPLVDDENEIFMQRLSSTAAEIGSDVRVSVMGPNGNTTYDAARPAVAYNSSSNNYFVVWHSDHNAGGVVEGENEIYGQIVSNLGVTGTTFRISDMGTDGNTAFSALNPAVQHDPNLNQFLVTWQGDDNTVPVVDGEFEIYGQLVSGAGAETGVDFRLSDVGGSGNVTYNAARSAIIYNNTAREFLIAWDADDNIGSMVDEEFEIWGQRFAELSPSPTAQPTTPVFSSVTSSSFTVTFTAATGTPDGYIVLRKSGSSPTDIPNDHSVYNVGDVIGTSTVAYVGSATTFDETGLASSNEYHYDFFSYNGVNSSTIYRTTTPLEGNVTTLAPEPAGQPVTLLFSNPTTSSMNLAFTAASGPPDGYLVLRKEGTAPTDIPVDATAYVAGAVIGTSTVAYVGATLDFDDTGLSSNTIYHYAIFSFNGSGVTLNYLVTSPLTGSRTTLQTEAADQPTLLAFSDVTPTSMNGSFTAASGPPDGYIVVRQAGASPTDIPEDGIPYTAGAAIGASVVVYVGSESSFSSTSLSPGVEYHYDVFSFNGSDDATNYLLSTPLEASQVTTVVEPATQPTDITFSALTPSSMDVSFTAVSEAPGGYIVLRKSVSSPTDVPVDGISYVAGGMIGTSDIVYVGSEATFSNTGLTSCTEYFYAVFSFNGVDATINYLVTSPLEGSKSTILAGPTEQPSAITFDTYTTTSYTVNFEAAAVSPTGYIAIRNAESAPTDVPVDGTDYIAGNTLGDGVVAFVGSTTSFNETGLSPGTAYFYNIYAFNGSGSCINYLTTAAPEGSSITLCEEPAEVSATEITQESFKLSWSVVTGAASYELEVSKDDFITLIGGSTQTFVDIQRTIDGLESGTTYAYRLRAINASGESANSMGSVLTVPATPVIKHPRENINQGSFIVSWDAVTGADNYVLEVSINDTFLEAVIQYQTTSTTFTVEDLATGTDYYLRLRSGNSSGDSPSSLSVRQATLPGTPIPSIAQDDIDDDSFKVTWTATDGATGGYELEVSQDNFTSLLENYNPAVITSGLDIVVEGLDANTVYQIRMRAKNGDGLYSPTSETVSVETEQPNNANDLKIIADPQNTQPLSNGFVTTKLEISVTGGTPPYNVRMHHRKIMDPGFSTTTMDLVSDGNYEVTVDDNMLDDFGIEYYFEVTDTKPNTVRNPESVQSFIYRKTDSSLKIEGLSFGGKPENYRIISIPYDLEDESAEYIFRDVTPFGDKKVWRLVHYEAGKNADVKRFDLIKPGLGYWFNSVKPVEIKLGEGTVPQFNQSSPFILRVGQGWNQIGNPYPFSIDWSDVKSANPDAPVSSLKIFDLAKIGLETDDDLDKWSGGFVFADAEVDLIFPLTLKKDYTDGRKAKDDIANSFLDKPEWILPLTLKHDIGENDMIGIGMHPEASESKDKFDEISVPRFVKYLEMETKHEEYFAPYFTRDVVPTTDQYTWNFTVHSNFGEEKATLTWDTEALGNNAAKLILYDVEAQQFIDMKVVNRYSFSIGNGRKFKFIFTNSDYHWRPDFTTLGKPYPNPSSGQVTIPLVVEKESTPVTINVLDMFGKHVRTLVNQTFDHGIYDIIWNDEDNISSKIAVGMYLIQMKVDSGPQKVMHKIIVK